MRRSPDAEAKMLAAIAEVGPRARNRDLQDRTGFAASTVRNLIQVLGALGRVRIVGRGRWRRIEPSGEAVIPNDAMPSNREGDFADRPGREPVAEAVDRRMRRATRLCLGCQRDFLSSWCGERMCGYCKKRSVGDG